MISELPIGWSSERISVVDTQHDGVGFLVRAPSAEEAQKLLTAEMARRTSAPLKIVHLGASVAQTARDIAEYMADGRRAQV